MLDRHLYILSKILKQYIFKCTSFRKDCPLYVTDAEWGNGNEQKTNQYFSCGDNACHGRSDDSVRKRRKLSRCHQLGIFVVSDFYV